MIIPLLLISGIGLLIIGIGLLLFRHEPCSDDHQENIRAIQKGFSPHMSGVAASFRANRAEKLTNYISKINQQTGQVVEMINQKAIAEQAQLNYDDVYSNHQLNRQKVEADHDAYIALSDNRKAVAEMATLFGLDPATMRELVLEQARMKVQIATKQQEMQLDVEKHRQMKQVDFEFEYKIAQLDTQMADLAHLLPQHQLEVLHNQLSGIHFEYEQAKQLGDGDYKKRELRRIERKMKTWKKNINGREKELS